MYSTHVRQLTFLECAFIFRLLLLEDLCIYIYIHQYMNLYICIYTSTYELYIYIIYIFMQSIQIYMIYIYIWRSLFKNSISANKEIEFTMQGQIRRSSFGKELCIDVFIYIHIYTHVNKLKRALHRCVHIYIYMYIYIYIWTHMWTNCVQNHNLLTGHRHWKPIFWNSILSGSGKEIYKYVHIYAFLDMWKTIF